ncbi:MAG: alpha/beta fold hydrolase [Microbacteriaceae bacterium]
MAVPDLEAVVSGLALEPSATEVVILGSALGSDHRIWDDALPELEALFTVIRFDLPGHGVTPRAESRFTMDELADAVIELADRQAVHTFRFAGVSIGGALALVLSRRYPERVVAAGVVCSAATFGGVTSGFLERAESVRAEGMGFVTPAIPGRWFAPAFIEHEPEIVERIVDMVGSCDPEGYAQCCEALATYDESARLGEILVPVVVVSGELDPGSTPQAGAVVAEGVRNGRLAVIAGASHLAVVEIPHDVMRELVLRFTGEVPIR